MRGGKHGPSLWKDGLAKDLEYLLCHIPTKRWGRERFSVQGIQIVCVPERGPYSGSSSHIPDLCLGAGIVVISQLCQDTQGYQTCPSWQRGCKKHHTSLGYGFILVLRVCMPCPVLQ